jgi:SAM-dependent methyltransferase
MKSDTPLDNLLLELAPFQKYIAGKVLNAGSGSRKLKFGSETINLDIDPNNRPDVLADLNTILPFDDDAFDTIVSVACLEHVPRPWYTIKELYRVVRPGGFAVICIPFMQPFHAWPHDYTRFTNLGMESLLKEGGFTIVEVRANKELRFGYTLSWMLTEYYAAHPRLWSIMRFFWKPIFFLMRRGIIFSRTSPHTESAYYAVGKKI